MSSLRQHRVIIASLFLPTTVERQPALSVDSLQSRRPPKQPTPHVLTPRSELSNPFQLLPLESQPATRPSPKALQRNRSSSRRPNKGGNSAWNLEPNSHSNIGLKNAIDSVQDRLRRVVWVGALGTGASADLDAMDDGTKADVERALLQQNQSVPVWIPDAEFESCYDKYCHQVLWPCLHYAIPDAPKTKFFDESASFQEYLAVNRRFADTIAANYQEGDIIWVNDYHLMLLPALLRSVLPTHTPIGFFLHVAFPSSEIFRCLVARRALLNGILGADLIGFQTANYARHFRQTVARILSLETVPKGIQLHPGVGEGVASPSATGGGSLQDHEAERVGGAGGGRFVDVGVFAMGIDVKALKEKRRDPEVAEWVQILKQRYAGMYLVVGRDKLDTVQGVRQKIQAFEYFLDKYPEFQGKTVLIQVALTTTESNQLAGGVGDVVAHLNARFSTLTYEPVVFLHTDELTFSQYLALLTVADAFLVASLREGMALRTHEFVECQVERHRPLILSEFTGSYSYSGFRSCIAINPWDTRETAKAIYRALTMSDEEALMRWEDLHRQVNTQTAQAFVTSFLTRCLRAHNASARVDVSLVPTFDVLCVLSRYRNCGDGGEGGGRLLLLDLEGTLWLRDPVREQGGRVPEGVVGLLVKLVSLPGNRVWVLSGLPIAGALEELAEKVPGLGIVAENGCFIWTIPSRSGQQPRWINMVANFDLSWKASCLELLHYFTERTPGSFIEEREASVAWRFWTGVTTEDSKDRQWARRQAAEAQNHIFDSLGERYGLRIIPGQNSFLILPNNVSRSTAVGAILHPGGPAHSPGSGIGRVGAAGGVGRGAFLDLDRDGAEGVATDAGFVLAVGSDEKLLKRLNEMEVEHGSQRAETCSTGGRRTDARWRLDKEGVMDVMWKLANVSTFGMRG